MKRFLLSLLSIACLGSAQAQLTNFTTGQTAPDFTVTDIHGKEHKLYEITASGKYVVLDFFFVTCGPCQAMAPTLTEFYQKYGCNQGNVYVISIDNGDNTAAVQQFETQYSGANAAPSVSGTDGGGNAVNSTYGPSAYPTVAVIDPNNKFIATDVWPVSNVGSLEAVFPNGALTPMTCTVGIEHNSNTAGQVNAVFPNPASHSTTLNFSIQEEADVQFHVYNVIGKRVYAYNYGKHPAGTYSMELPVENLAMGNYLIHLTINDTTLDVIKLTVTK